MHHFGRPIVGTPGNFGFNGSAPTHPELLDWLAAEFIRSGWRTKTLHRLIMTSGVYRQAAYPNSLPSTAPDPAVIDPENTLYSRMPLRRIEAEVVRDAMLSASGSLDQRFGGPPIPLIARPDGRVEISQKELANPSDRERRSLYLMARRNYLPSLLSVFDAPLMTGNCTQRLNSVVPSQALTMLNNAFVVEQSERISARIVDEWPEADVNRRVDQAFRLILSRPATGDECLAAVELVNGHRRRMTSLKSGISAEVADRQALNNLCLMLLNTNEFLYLE
jgi:hypothetical protein